MYVGEKGIAYTLVTEKDKEFAGHLVRNLEGANQAVPQALMDLAMQVILIHFIIRMVTEFKNHQGIPNTHKG